MSGESLSAELSELLSAVVPPEAARPEAVRRHLDSLTKPPGSLGRLEDAAVRLACILGDPPPPLRHRTVFVLAGDHGVAERGVSAYPPEVTAQMCLNFARGGAAINAIARTVGADVVVADLAVRVPIEPGSGVLDRNVRRGTADLTRGPALTMSETVRAVLSGAALVDERLDALDVACLGEMGIGNTTAASALTAALTASEAKDVVGTGTGVDDAGMVRKREAVATALGRLRGDESPLELLAELGGGEIAGLVGVVLAMARAGRPVVTDGFIATAAALVATRLAPAAVHALFAAHRSTEPGHGRQLAALGLDPLLDLGLRLGEGTGGALALPILDAAGAILRDMATFEGAGVSGAGA